MGFSADLVIECAPSNGKHGPVYQLLEHHRHSSHHALG